MIDRARLTIIASVPFAMAFQLLLLNYYFNPQINSQINNQINNQIKPQKKAIIKKITKKVDTNVKVEKRENSGNMNKFFGLIDPSTVNIIYSPPAPHTFIVKDSEI